MRKRHVRNPIKRHGAPPSSNFTMIPNELIRQGRLNPRAFQVAAMLRSHADGYEVSIQSLADDLGCQRETVSKAMVELVDVRWLAIRRVKTAKGTRAYEEYHLNMSRAFTEDEAAELNNTVKLSDRINAIADCGHGGEGDMFLSDIPSSPLRSNGYLDAWKASIKEYQLEDQIQEKEEELSRTVVDQSEPTPFIDDCWICVNSRVFMGEPCISCMVPSAYGRSEASGSVEQPTSKASFRPLDHVTSNMDEPCCKVCDKLPITNGRYCSAHLHLVASV